MDVPRTCEWPDDDLPTFPGRVWFPKPLDQAPGRWPVVVFIPPTQFDSYSLFTADMEFLASHGFVVVTTAEAGRNACMMFNMYMVRPTFTEADYCRMHSRLGCRGRDLLARLEEAHGDRGCAAAPARPSPSSPPPPPRLSLDRTDTYHHRAAGRCSAAGWTWSAWPSWATASGARRP